MKKTFILFFFLLVSHSLIAAVEWPSFTNQEIHQHNQISVDWLLEHLLVPLQNQQLSNRSAEIKIYQNYTYKIQKRNGFVPVIFEQLQDAIINRENVVELRSEGNQWNNDTPTNWMNYKLYVNNIAQEEVMVIGRWEIGN